MAQWTDVLGCGGHHIVFCDCAKTQWQQWPKKTFHCINERTLPNITP